jgi:hypothetical protein
MKISCMCTFNLLTELSYSKPLLSPCRAALGSETGFSLWGEEKARIRAFFLSRSALSLFFALFFWLRTRERESAKARKRKSAKKAPAPTSAHETFFKEYTNFQARYLSHC